MTYDEVVNEFKEHVLPYVIHVYEKDGERDVPARSEAWNDYTDGLCKDGIITDDEYSEWLHPSCCD